MADPLVAQINGVLGGTQQPDLRKYWDLGTLISSRMTLMGGRGTAVVEKLAAESGKSVESLRDCERFRRTWPDERVDAAEKANITWRNVIPMLTYSQQSHRLRDNAPLKDRERLMAIAQSIDQMLDDLIVRVGKKEIEPVGIKAYLDAWRKAHPEAFADKLSRRGGGTVGALDI